jgi:hypothetical protein
MAMGWVGVGGDAVEGAYGRTRSSLRLFALV